MRRVISSSAILLAASCSAERDNDRAPRMELESLRDDVARNRKQCDHPLEPENRGRISIRKRPVRIGKLIADIEWNQVAGTEDARIGEQGTETRQEMSDPIFFHQT